MVVFKSFFRFTTLMLSSQDGRRGRMWTLQLIDGFLAENCRKKGAPLLAGLMQLTLRVLNSIQWTVLKHIIHSITAGTLDLIFNQKKLEFWGSTIQSSFNDFNFELGTVNHEFTKKLCFQLITNMRDKLSD